MYQFERKVVGRFALHHSRPEPGEQHVKRFLPGTNPANQATLNLYVAGSFELHIPSINYRRTMNHGECSLDIELPEYPAQACIERCLTPGAHRICVSLVGDPARWRREVLELPAGSAVPGEADQVLIVLSGCVIVDGATLHPGDATALSVDSVLRSEAPTRAVLLSA